MTLDAAQLKIDLSEGEAWRRTLAVTVPADIVRTERRKIAKTLAARVRIPGFRSGKIPASVMEKRFGAALNQEMVDRVVGDAYREALKASDLSPISEGEVEELEYEPDAELTFRISFDVNPEIAFARVGGFAVERPAAVVKDEDVDRVLERLRDQNGTWAPAEEGRPTAGDLVSVSVTRLDSEDGDEEPRPYDLILGEGDAIPDVESAIYTLDVGAQGEFDVTFPDDFPNEERRGQSEKLEIQLRERKIRELPEGDDAFARSLGDFEDLDTLRGRIREDLEKEAGDQSEGAVRGQLLNAIIEANPFEVPSSMVDRYLDSILGDGQGADPERLAQARDQLRGEAVRSVQRILVIERIAEQQELQSTDDEIDARVEEIAEKNDSNPAEVYARLQKAGRIDQLEREITEQKVFDYLKEQSTITDASA
ncbi:MAG: trigger factor [Gemmatimonadetes bacterium]|nr:trigger factor [Gemmatimonadota bacterium]